VNSKHDYKPLFTLNYYNRTLQLTREGGGFVVLVFGVGLGAINTGNNLLYLILAMCCSFIVVSGVLSELTFRDVTVQGSMRAAIYARHPYPVTLRVFNHKQRWPSFSLFFHLPQNPAYQAEKGQYVFHLPVGGNAEKNILIQGLRRGPLAIDQCHISTSFPFGFFVKTKTVDLDIQTLVYPPLHPVDLPPPSTHAAEGDEASSTFGGSEFHGIREYQPGDPPRAIHWKSTAKTGVLRVKEFASGGRQKFTIHLNLADPQTGKTVPDEVLEQRVSETASLVYHLIRRGDEVSLRMADGDSPFDNSEAHLEHLLARLALAGNAAFTV
jgi:uncharacterized protein (DUF58 family)